MKTSAKTVAKSAARTPTKSPAPKTPTARVRTTTTSPDAAAKLAEQLYPAIVRLGRNLRREAIRVGLSAIDAQLLATVAIHPGVGVADLADLEQMSGAAMSAHVKRLLDQGWVCKQKDAPNGDKRRVGLELTTRGDAALVETGRQRNSWLASRLTHLSSAEVNILMKAIGPLNTLFEHEVMFPDRQR